MRINTNVLSNAAARQGLADSCVCRLACRGPCCRPRCQLFCRPCRRPCRERIYRREAGPFFSVTYLANGGSGSYTDRGIAEDSFYEIKSAEQTGISRPGYVLSGWNTEPDGSGETFKPDMGLNLRENLTLYAIWEPAAT